MAALLYAGFAWAADMPGETLFGHGAHWSQDADGQSDTGHAADACDHCCHGSAHYLGFPIAESATMAFGEDETVLHRERSHRSLAIPPPIQPPIA